MTEVVRADPALVQATADLLAARVGLFEQQPGSELVPVVDRCLEALMSPAMVVAVDDDAAWTEFLRRWRESD